MVLKIYIHLPKIFLIVSCSFEELQYIEAILTNDYVKNATRRLMYLMMNYGLDEEHCSLKVCQKR